MRAKAFSALGITAGLTLIAVGFLAATSPTSQFGEAGNAPVFPQLADQIDDINKIVIDQAKSELTIERSGENWLLADHDNYPADAEKVDQSIVHLATLRLVEPKTKKQQLYSKLEVEDPGLENAVSRRLEAFDSQGERLASVIIGKRKANFNGQGRTAFYLRRDSDEQAWLANGEINASTDLVNWAKTDLIGIDANEIESITIDREGLGTLRLVRIPGDDRLYSLEGVPEGFSPKPELQLQRVVDQFADLKFNDIRRVAGDGGTISTINLRSTDGLDFSIASYKDGEDRWVRVEVSGDGEAAARAETLSERLANREFRVSGRHATNVVISLGDLLKAAEEG